MKYALIGCGRISTNHVKAVVNNKLEFVAACDVVPEHIENVLAKHGLENDTSIKRYTDYKKMIEENEIEDANNLDESLYILVSSSHPNFNIWRSKFGYYETFPKEIDPNHKVLCSIGGCLDE